MGLSNLNKKTLGSKTPKTNTLTSVIGTDVSSKIISNEVIPTGEDYEAPEGLTFNILFGEDAEISYTLSNGDTVTEFPFAKGFILMGEIVKVESNEFKLLAFI